LTGEIAARYELGYAPPGWNHLLVDDEPETRSLLLEAGLLVRKEDETGHYDRFRDRIMFPIRDLRGRTIAFGGRVLGDAKPKYLNSPETPLFHKGRELYGLYEARRATNRLSRLIIVEGYLDVVALAQFGVTFAVATLGTATTDEHLGRLFRQVSDLVFCFDGDRAGQAAAGKALLLLLPHLEDGRRATFMFLPEGDDPDSVVRREGKEGFLDRVKAGLDVSAWLFEKLSGDLKSAGHDLASIAGKAALAKEAVKWISTMPAGAFKQLMLDEVTAKTGVAQQRLDQIAETLPVAQAVRPVDQSVETRSSAEVEPLPGRGDDQRAAVDTDLALLVLHPELAEDLDADVILGLGQEGADGVLRLVCENIRAEGLKTPGQLIGHFASSPLAKSLILAFDYTPVLDVSFLKSEFVERLRRRASRADHRRRQAEMAELIHRAPSSLSEEERQRLRQFYGQQKAD
jgi:DNA primase